MFKLREEDVMYDALFAPLSNYRESQQAYKTSSCIKTEPEEMVLAPLKPRSDWMEPSDFDKCEICINCKITHKQDTKLYIIKKKDLECWVSNHYLFITLQKDLTNVYVRPTD